ncbi:MAG: DUF5017 domain-containing protein [Bacteroidia bacterium]|nr:DUF5017 domain-containing protein [Bacteroidia bacterium]
MKLKINFQAILLLLIGGAAFISGCVKQDFESPALIIPKYTIPAGSKVIPVSQLLALHTDASRLDTLKSDTTDVMGVVIGTDQSGNIYKNIIIQDASGGLMINLDRVSYYTQYPLGQRVYVRCKGLVLGSYGGMTQLGINNAGAVGRIPNILIDTYLFNDSLPGLVPAPKIFRKFSNLSSSDWCKLVQFQNVSFADSGQTYYLSTDASATNHNLIDSTSATLVVRTSKYASFANNILPNGIGTVTGILTNFNGTNQLVIRDLNDIKNFAPVYYLINEPFTTTLGAFTQYSVTGAQTWHWATYSGSTYATMSGYSGGNIENEDWLLSPSLNFDQYTGEIMKFRTAMKYGTVGDGSLTLLYSHNYTGSGNPNAATWTPLTGYTLSTGNWTWTDSGVLDLSQITGTNVYIAFKYISTTSSAATWELTNITIRTTPVQ